MILNLSLKRFGLQRVKNYGQLHRSYTQGFKHSSLDKHSTARVNYVFNIVPQQEAWVVERFGKFFDVLSPGLHILIPVIDQIRYVQSLKEVAVSISEQSAITNDNVTLTIDGVLFYQVIDPYKASYQIEDHEYAIKQLAQTSMRSEIGKLVLDDVFKERDTLNKRIVDSIRTAAVKWGIECMRYEIRDVQPPARVLEAMQMQVEAERKKRAAVLESEGLREAAINKATGDAQAIQINAESRAVAIRTVAEAMSLSNASHAVCYTVAEQYISAFSKFARNTNTIILPKNMGDIPTSVAEAMAIYKNMSNDIKTQGGSYSPPSLSSPSNMSPPESESPKNVDLFSFDHFNPKSISASQPKQTQKQDENLDESGNYTIRNSPAFTK